MTYTVKATDILGYYKITANTRVVVKFTGGGGKNGYAMPTAFTPNSDGKMIVLE